MRLYNRQNDRHSRAGRMGVGSGGGPMKGVSSRLGIGGRRRRRRGLSFIEMLLGLSALTVSTGAVVCASDWLRAHTAYQETRDTLGVLHAALGQYHNEHGAWPPGPVHGALGALLDGEATAEKVCGLPLDYSPGIGVQVRDGYGQYLCYVTQDATHGTGTGFVSKGADGRLGDPRSEQPGDRLAATDDLYGSDVGVLSP